MDNSSSVHQLASLITVLVILDILIMQKFKECVKFECEQNCFPKAGFLTGDLDVNSKENALTHSLTQIYSFFIDVDLEDFLYYGEQLETQ